MTIVGRNASAHLFDTSFTTNGALYSAASGVLTSTASANNSILITNGSGVPSLGTTLANSFSFAASSSGATVSSTVSNTSNTASSNALQQVTVAGTSAGDAFTTYTVTGTTNWSMGTDNSVTGDPFVIAASTALGTTNIMSSTTAGEINYPLQPAFLANNSVADANVTGDGTTYVIICDTEIYDQNADYNNATGTFTAPVTGRYQVSSVIHISNIATASFNTGFGDFVASNRTIFFGVGNVSATKRVGANDATIEGSIPIDMDAADIVNINVSINGSTKTLSVDTLTYFSANLLC